MGGSTSVQRCKLAIFSLASGKYTMDAALAVDGGLPAQGRVLSQAYCRRMQIEIASEQELGLWPSGFRRMKVATSVEDGAQVPRGFGFPGLFNNLGYCDPEEGLGVAILVNQLDTEGTAAKDILDAISSVLHVARHSKDGLGVSE